MLPRFVKRLMGTNARGMPTCLRSTSSERSGAEGRRQRRARSPGSDFDVSGADRPVAVFGMCGGEATTRHLRGGVDCRRPIANSGRTGETTHGPAQVLDSRQATWLPKIRYHRWRERVQASGALAAIRNTSAPCRGRSSRRRGSTFRTLQVCVRQHVRSHWITKAYFTLIITRCHAASCCPLA
jgi:hypothetical protein